MNYDSYQWMANGKVIGSSRTINLTANELPLNTQTTVTLGVTFRGYKFEDSANVTLTSSSTAIETNELNNQVKAFYCSPDKSIHIEFPDSYSDIEVSLISIEGKVICKQRATSGSKAIKIPASSIAKGVYMVHINFGAQDVIKKIVLM
nr:T9SS type A sorting domain-containing protein [uncultured Bacteroides sp.]